MEPIEPIFPRTVVLPGVQPAARTAPVHRDGRDGRGGGGGQRRPRREGQPVEIDVAGVEEAEELEQLEAPVAGLLEAPVHRIDLTSDDDPAPPERRIDLSA